MLFVFPLSPGGLDGMSCIPHRLCERIIPLSQAHHRMGTAIQEKPSFSRLTPTSRQTSMARGVGYEEKHSLYDQWNPPAVDRR